MALRDVLVHFGVTVDQSELGDLDKRVTGMFGKFGALAKAASAFGAALAGAAITRFIADTVKAADDIGDMAARLGIATDEFQVLKAVADDVGSSVGNIQTGFRSLAEKMKSGSAEFGKLGVATRDADGSMRSVTDVFWEVGTALGATEDQATRLQLTQQLLGRGGLQLLPIFAGGAEAVAKYRAEIAETAVVFDEAFIEASDRTAKRLDHLNRRFERIKVMVVSHLLPAFDYLLHKLEAAVKVVSDFVKSGKALQAVLALGSRFILQWAAGFALTGAKLGGLSVWLGRVASLSRILFRFLLRFALPVLILDELITLFRGGDTLIGRFIDKLFGVGKAAAMVDLVRGAVSSLLDTLSLLFGGTATDDWAMSFIKASEGIGKAFDAMFAGLWQVAKDFAEFFSLVIGQAVDWIVGKIKAIPGGEWLVEQASKLGESAGRSDEAASGAARAAIGGGSVPMLPSIAPPPALSPSAAAAAGAPMGPPALAPQVTNNITVEGSATPAVAREIASRTGSATSASLGRDRAAIGAAVGVGSP